MIKDEWRSLAEQFKNVRDALGRPIDPAIFDMVVTLNALGFQTYVSCEGHLEEGRGLLLPYVDISSGEIKTMTIERLALHRELAPWESRIIDGSISDLARGNPEHEKFCSEYDERKRPIEAMRREANAKLYDIWYRLYAHLTKFFSGKGAPSLRLTLQNRTEGNLRLMPDLPGGLITPRASY